MTDLYIFARDDLGAIVGVDRAYRVEGGGIALNMAVDTTRLFALHGPYERGDLPAEVIEKPEGMG